MSDSKTLAIQRLEVCLEVQSDIVDAVVLLPLNGRRTRLKDSSWFYLQEAMQRLEVGLEVQSDIVDAVALEWQKDTAQR